MEPTGVPDGEPSTPSTSADDADVHAPLACAGRCARCSCTAVLCSNVSAVLAFAGTESLWRERLQSDLGVTDTMDPSALVQAPMARFRSFHTLESIVLEPIKRAG